MNHVHLYSLERYIGSCHKKNYVRCDKYNNILWYRRGGWPIPTSRTNYVSSYAD